MNLRLVKIFIPLEGKKKVEGILKEHEVSDFWHDRIGDKKLLTRALVSAEGSESILDSLESAFQGSENFHVVLLPVEASIPRFEEEDTEKKNTFRVSREELYQAIAKNTGMGWVYISLVIFSAIVAAVGMIQGNIPMIVGAMVIAPFIGPSIGFSFATTLGDLHLLRKSLITLFSGVVVAIIFSSLIGAFFHFDISQEIYIRTNATFSDMIVSLVSGSVGVLSYTTATLTSLAGVMVAVALLPPLVVSGMLLGAGELSLAWGAFLLFMVNLIGINLSGVITFFLQKIHPRTYMEKEKARWVTSLAVIFLIALLLFVILLLLL